MDTATPKRELFSAHQVLVAVLLGSPLAAAYFMSRNEAVWGTEQESRRVLLYGIGFTLIMLIIGFLLPENFPSAPIAIAGILGVRAWYQRAQEARYKQYMAAGSVTAGWGKTIGISLLFLVTLLAVAFGIAVLLSLFENEAP